MDASVGEPTRLREHYETLQAEVISLRLDLTEAVGLIDALEAELWRADTRWRCQGDERSAAGMTALVIRARTLMRRTVAPWLEDDEGRRAMAQRDLRISEAAFGLLLRLRAVRGTAVARP